MVSSINLGSSITNNLLSIQNTQRLVDQTSLRLATGLKVNSALDNAQNYFAARSLNNRASDLTRLLDGIKLNIKTVQQANTGVEALSELVDQGQSIAQQAVDLIAQAPKEPIVIGNKDISQVADLTTLDGINAGDRIAFGTRPPDSIIYAPLVRSFTITAGLSANELVSRINTLNDLIPNIVDVQLTEDGFLQFGAPGDYSFNIEFLSASGTDSDNQALASALGYSEIAPLLGDGTGNNEVQFTLHNSRTLTSFQLFNAATNQTATRYDPISSLEGPGDSLIFFSLDSAADIFEIGVNDEDRVSININSTTTVQDFLDAINGDASLNTLIEAGFDEGEGRITIEAIDLSVEKVQTSIVSDGLAAAFFGFNIGPPIYGTGADVDVIHLGTIGGTFLDELRALEEDYSDVLQAIDDITKDSNFRGINLLAGDDLTTFFNEDLSSSLLTEGINFTALGLDLQEASFRNAADAQVSLDVAAQARDTVRQYASTLANNLSVIENRLDFTRENINISKAGADDLTQADLNEEGAILLALQTRQTLGVTALSIGVQQGAGIIDIFVNDD